jgi:UDPglucose 6-dehydrogenase
VEQADVTVVLTEWNEFRALSLENLRSRMRGDVLVDLRNVYEPQQAGAAGFSYASIGR